MVARAWIKAPTQSWTPCLVTNLGFFHFKSFQNFSQVDVRMRGKIRQDNQNYRHSDRDFW